jgi:hypothetical protein
MSALNGSKETSDMTGAGPPGLTAGECAEAVRAGTFDAALRLLATAEAGPLTELQRARADLLHGQVAFASGSGGDAPLLLLKAAKRLEPLDARLARTELQGSGPPLGDFEAFLADDA